MVLGIDIGACYTKGVLLAEDGIKDKVVVKTAFQPQSAIEEVKKNLIGYRKIVATGYGRNLVTDADLIITE
ncbi:MAG: hypothetical protein ABIL00_07380, partial [candidate division WOR-3 bacterium]